jgi:hypothetical protein
MSFAKDFRDFILRGNVVDLAVGVVIGAAFSGVVDPLRKRGHHTHSLGIPGAISVGDITFTIMAAVSDRRIHQHRHRLPDQRLRSLLLRGAPGQLAHGAA